MNEQRETIAHAAADPTMRCECECHRTECGNNFTISLENYELVRASGRRFVVAPGHQHPGESVLSAGPAYLVIEKRGADGRTAMALNPREVASRSRFAPG